MSDHYTLLVSNNISEEERRRRRKRKRVVVALVVSIMALIAKRYHRRRPRHLANANEVLERRVQERKQMLRNSTYGWSLEPISRHFNEVLQGVLSLRNVESTSQRATLSPRARHSTSTTILSMACCLQVVLAGIGKRTGFQ